ncbi:MAG: 30S ribosomal protein S8 [Candidatus Saccharicenans sp.]|jgi:small subunit ribosomal protein S8|nr:30S ribosomal protein S8 [Candidatus Saccharicenans sp.]MCX8159402.1 30S ribosomal protein S8 [Candidatus Saccharicenans sp.]MDH7575463.1 30S ribosomal protein S8 [Candidatus Saccharicenans sp.]
MSLTDPIADMLTRIRNAVRAKKKEVNVPSSRLKVEIARILKEEGYIKNYKVIEDNKQGVLNIVLKYTDDNQSVISGLRRVSKPGCRIYCTRDSIPRVLDGLGVVIISTSRGLLTDKQCQEQGLGGEVLCEIW